MSLVGIPQHWVHGSRGRLKTWLIAFNFDRFRAHPDPTVFFAGNLPMGCDMTYNTSRVLRTIWTALECHQTTHLWFCGAATEWSRNDRKRCSYARSKSWEFLMYHPMSPGAIPWHSVHGSRGRLKAWLIAFNFERSRAPPGPVIFFVENRPMGCATTYNASLVLRTIWIIAEFHQTTHLLFWRAPTKWPWNSRKSCTYARSKSWKSLIYHPMSPRGIPRHLVHGS